jgi:hypothetical protein
MAGSTLELRAADVHTAGPSSAATAPVQRSAWLLGPWLDALLVANVAWPLVLLMHWGEGFAGREGVHFWQVYFLTTPHRWITLALVFFDRQRLAERRATFFLIAAAVIAVCLGVQLTTGTLTCLLTIDYLWNAWHFASQHHGVYRIYGRRSAPASQNHLALEKWTMRLVLLYVIVRVAGATWSYPGVERSLQALDWFVAAAAVALIVRDLVQPASTARTLYLASVMTLYLGLLAAVHYHQPGLVLSMAAASAIFHATEYLALVSWSVHGRAASLGGRLGVMSYLVPRWGLVLAVFMLVLGSSGWLLEHHLLRPWLLVNVMVAFLHYAYDGLIWRRGSAADRTPALGGTP